MSLQKLKIPAPNLTPPMSSHLRTLHLDNGYIVQKPKTLYDTRTKYTMFRKRCFLFTLSTKTNEY